MSEQLPIIDWKQHAQSVDASADMSKELLELFIQQLPEMQDKLQQAFARQDNEALEATLHRLQGACAYCGLPRLRQVVADAEREIKQAKQLSAQRFEQIMGEIIVVKDELGKHGIVALN